MLTQTALTVTLLSLATPALGEPDSPSLTGSPGTTPLPYEVNTHQLFSLLAARRSANFDRFLADFGLEDTDYSRRYPEAAENQSSLITITNSRAIDLIGAGAVLEDGNRRYFNHFHDPVNNRGLDIAGVRYAMARDWALNGAGEANAYSLQAALEYYARALTATTPADRRAAQEDLFVTLGHLTHLVQDCLQPSHTRNDPHSDQLLLPDGHSALEHFGRDFVHGGAIPASIKQAIDRQGPLYLPQFVGYYDQAAAFSNEFFFSDDTIFEDYALPSVNTTSTRSDNIDGRPVTMVTSNTLTDPATRTNQRLARENRGLFWNSYTLESPQNAVLVDNYESLAPRAVALCAGLIDHLLRGRLQLTLDSATSTRLVVQNISGANGSSDPADMTMTSGSFRLYYESVSGRMIELPAPMSPQSLSGPLASRQEIELNGDVVQFLNERSNPSLGDDQRAREDKRMLVLFDGDIGSERGLAAARIAFTDDVSLLLSFDVSGSISRSELASAQAAARSLLTLLRQGTDNRVELQSWSTRVTVNQPFTSDLNAVENAVNRLNTGGGTALFDATAAAGDSCLTEAQNNVSNGDTQREILVLFTDGSENSSRNATISSAAAAISRAGRPEIDEVFLVFVGGASGRATLSDMSALAGRPFFEIQDFADLTKEFQNLLQSTP